MTTFSMIKVTSMALRRLGRVALAASFSTLSLSVAVPTALAAPDNSTAVISEVYGGGGNKGREGKN